MASKCQKQFCIFSGVPEYLSKAIQKNVVALVTNMPFNESYIPDELIAEGCITEDECKLAREKKERKDQVRKIVTLIRGRSFPAMEKFLKVIGKESNCPTIVMNIWKHYEELNQTNLIGEGRCCVCKVKADVDVRYVMDYLWQENAISSSLYEQLCDAKEVKGHQGHLWDNVLKQCHENQRLDKLNFALECKGHYPHIADDFRTQVRLGLSVMECACVRQTIFEETLSIDSLTSRDPQSTASSRQSIDFKNDALESDELDSSRVSINKGSAKQQRIHTDRRSQSDRTTLVSKDNKSERENENIEHAIDTDTCFPMSWNPFKGKK